MAWFMPFFGIAVGGYAVRSVLKGWSRTDTKRKSPALSDEDRAKLDAVLKDRE
jgi:cytochrome c-type biogenesis protein CcmH/NrfF